MTEEEWNAARAPAALVCEVRKRKLIRTRTKRLFACGCYRLIWDRITFRGIRECVELAEALADRQVRAEVARRFKMGRGKPPVGSIDRELMTWVTDLLRPKLRLGEIAWHARHAAHPERFDPDIYLAWEDCPEQADLLRDIFGNPFRPVAFDPKWRTEAAVGLALRMYDDRDFAAMSILADALQEAGCEHPDILTHCREPGTHVRGCWVVDLVLGKG